jgi:hypothetical protein
VSCLRRLHLLHAIASWSDTITQRLIRDLDRWRALEHPNIGPILGTALHISNLPALVIPYYRTVAQVLAENACTDVLHLVENILLQMSHQLNYCTDAGSSGGPELSARSKSADYAR